MPERPLVRDDYRGKDFDRGLASALQREPSSHGSWKPNAAGISFADKPFRANSKGQRPSETNSRTGPPDPSASTVNRTNKGTGPPDPSASAMYAQLGVVEHQTPTIASRVRASQPRPLAWPRACFKINTCQRDVHKEPKLMTFLIPETKRAPTPLRSAP